MSCGGPYPDARRLRRRRATQPITATAAIATIAVVSRTRPALAASGALVAAGIGVLIVGGDSTAVGDADIADGGAGAEVGLGVGAAAPINRRDPDQSSQS